MARLFLFFLASSAATASSFVLPRTKPSTIAPAICFVPKGKKSDSDDDVVQKSPVLSVGSFVEFAEKGRVHIGKIASSEHKAKGGARYDVTDGDGRHYDIPDKAVNFATGAPTSPPVAEKLFNEMMAVQSATEIELESKLDVTPELVEMAWEEAASEEDVTHQLTPSSFVDLIHSHAASPIERYMAWRLLRTDMAHVFFRELKEGGRVVAFKAKARKAVENAKAAFCSKGENREAYDFCFV